MKRFLLFSAVFVLVTTQIAQSKQATLEKVYVGSDGLAHVVASVGKDIAIQKEKDQVEVSAPKLAADGQTAGWLVHRDNCCTSYSIPTRLVIYRKEKKLILSDGLMIYDWCFVAAGDRVAMSTGTVHGMTSRHLLLYDVRSGRQLQEWSGELDGTPPSWATDLTQ